MAETKFTPGPWDRDEGDFSIYQLETSEPITEAMDVVKNGDANSLLIAAAPELYEALENAISAIRCLATPDDVYGSYADAFDNILRKARGEYSK